MNILENEGALFIERPGKYPVTIADAKEGFDSNADETVSVTYEAEDGSSIKCRYTNNKSWGWKLAKLCRACSLTDKQLENFSAQMLVGKQVLITVKKEIADKYPNVWDVEALPSELVMPEIFPEQPAASNDDVPF